MGKLLKIKYPPQKLKHFYDYKYRKCIRTKNDDDDISVIFSKLNLTNVLMNKIYYDVIKNNQYCIQKYGIEFIVMNCKNVIGCTKVTLYDYIKNNLCDGMSLDNYSMWQIGHRYPFNVERNKETLYIIEYFNYKNLVPEWKHMK